MPELPEVEVVRAGLQRWVAGREVVSVEVLHPRAIRRQEGGTAEIVAGVVGRVVACASRRGKYLWLPLVAPGELVPETALIAHLGMSGQLLIELPEAPDERHLRVRFGFADGGRELRFVDQRTFGGLWVTDLVPDDAGGRVPREVAHIARDLLDSRWDELAVVRDVRRRDSEIKRVLLDQTVASGIGNIYADEALWRARIHGRCRARSLTAAQVRDLLGHARDVMEQALAEGGTSFDSLYVNVNGQSGYFDRSLAAYGREGEPCGRCGTPIRREAFMNRSSFWCPSCQRAPRRRAAPRG